MDALGVPSTRDQHITSYQPGSIAVNLGIAGSSLIIDGSLRE